MSRNDKHSVRFNDPKWAKIVKQAEKEGRSPSNLVKWAVDKYLEEKRGGIKC